MGCLTMTYFHERDCSLSSARPRFTVLFGMGRGGSRALCSSDIDRALPVGQGQEEVFGLCGCYIKRVLIQGYRIKPLGQLVRVSSTRYRACTPRLSTSWSRTTLQGGLNPPGSLILRQVSRLDAFSGYLFRTWLPGDATGVTTGTLVVRPLRSSRTRSSPSQTSNAHGR